MNSFFGLGPMELLVIVFLALIVLGPQRLPGTIREVMKYWRYFRNLSGELTAQLGEEFKDLDDLSPQRILEDLANELDEEAKQTKSAASLTKKPASKTAAKTDAKKSTTAKTSANAGAKSSSAKNTSPKSTGSKDSATTSAKSDSADDTTASGATAEAASDAESSEATTPKKSNASAAATASAAAAVAVAKSGAVDGESSTPEGGQADAADEAGDEPSVVSGKDAPMPAQNGDAPPETLTSADVGTAADRETSVDVEIAAVDGEPDISQDSALEIVPDSAGENTILPPAHDVAVDEVPVEKASVADATVDVRTVDGASADDASGETILRDDAVGQAGGDETAVAAPVAEELGDAESDVDFDAVIDAELNLERDADNDVDAPADGDGESGIAGDVDSPAMKKTVGSTEPAPLSVNGKGAQPEDEG